MDVRYKISSATIIEMALAGATAVFCLLAFWTKADLGGLVRVFHHNLLVASVSFAFAIAIQLVFFSDCLHWIRRFGDSPNQEWVVRAVDQDRLGPWWEDAAYPPKAVGQGVATQGRATSTEIA
jgi:hypothetical protein